MTRRTRPAARAPAAAALAVVLLGGCAGPGTTTSPTTPATASAPAGPTVTVGDLVVEVEVADTPAARSTGLSGRDALEAGTGMLFVFEAPGTHTFWMPDMAFAVDLAWIADGAVVGVETMTPCAEEDPQECRRWTSPGPIDAALEVPAGTLDGVAAGTPVEVTGAAGE